MDNNLNRYFIEYLNSISESRRTLNMMATTLQHQEQNINNIFYSLSRNNFQIDRQPRPSTRPSTRPYTNQPSQQQPNYPPRVNRFNNNFFREIFNLNQMNMEPVIVRPTRQQILQSTQTVRVGDIALVNRYYNVCPISYETFTNDTIVTKINHCGHFFDTNSINRWFERNVRCPVCRYDIRQNLQNNSGVVNDDNLNTFTDISSNNQQQHSSSNERPVIGNTINTRTNYSTTSTSTNPINSFIAGNIASNTAGNTAGSTNGSIANNIDNLFSTLQQYMSSYNLNPEIIQLEYSFIPLDISNNETSENTSETD